MHFHRMREFVLVTGASAGIGEALALEFAREGNNVMLVARNQKKLAAVATTIKEQTGVEVETVAVDLSKPQAAKKIALAIKKKKVFINTLVNNAGFGLHGQFINSELKDELNMVDLNVKSVVELSKLVLEQMRIENRGKILNVASTGAFQPGPMMSIYYASKAFVLSFSEALSTELQGTGIAVCCLCPGPVSTPFHERAGSDEAGLSSGTFLPVLSAEKVARYAVKKLKKNKRVMVPGSVNKILVQSLRFSPRWLVNKIALKIIG